ncbi:MAG: hypothetical protein Q9170_006323 [Blastenia crenularia]
MSNIVYPYFFILCMFWYSCQSRITPVKPRQASNKTLSLKSTTSGSASRKVYIVTDLHLTKRAVSRRTGRSIYGGHAQMWIDGTDSDGPVIVEVGFSPVPPPTGPPKTSPYAIRVKDLGVANTGQPLNPHQEPQDVQHTLTEGETSLTNAEMFGLAKGMGLIADAWMENPRYRMGTGSRPNTCYDLLERILGRIHLRLDPLTKQMFDISTEYYTDYSRKVIERVQDVASITVEPAGDGTDKVQAMVWNVESDFNSDAPNVVF